MSENAFWISLWGIVAMVIICVAVVIGLTIYKGNEQMIQAGYVKTEVPLNYQTQWVKPEANK